MKDVSRSELRSHSIANDKYGCYIPVWNADGMGNHSANIRIRDHA